MWKVRRTKRKNPKEGDDFYWEIWKNFWGDSQQFFYRGYKQTGAGDIYRRGCSKCKFDEDGGIFCSLWNKEFGYSSVQCSTPRYIAKRLGIYKLLCKLNIHNYGKVYQGFKFEKEGDRCYHCGKTIWLEEEEK